MLKSQANPVASLAKGAVGKMTLVISLEQPHGSMTYPKGDTGDLKERLGTSKRTGAAGLIFLPWSSYFTKPAICGDWGILCSVLPHWRREREGHGLHSFCVKVGMHGCTWGILAPFLYLLTSWLISSPPSHKFPFNSNKML